MTESERSSESRIFKISPAQPSDGR